MTQNTQTTAERIATLINEGIDCSCDSGWTSESLVGTLAVAQTIAAEIDALAAQLAEARAEVNRLLHERDAAQMSAGQWRAEVERLRPAAEAFGWWENYASNPSTTTWDIFQDAAQRARDMSFIESRAVILTDDQIDALKRGIARAAKESQP